MLPRLRALFFSTDNGREPVRDWLMGLHADERKQIGTDIAYVQFKWPIGKPRVDHLRGPIWEIRTRLPSRNARVLFAVAGNELILLHGFIKQTQKTPNVDISLAEARWKEWQDAEKQ
jgi:phage-related protein